MFCDEADIHIKAGDGGKGTVSFLHEKYREFGGPDGGNGGKGGDIIFKANSSLNTLYFFKSHRILKAEKGEDGGHNKKNGRKSENLVVEVPVGTLVTDLTGAITADLGTNNMEVVIAKGGDGGFGNAHFTSSVRQAPQIAEVGEKGEEMDLKLELKLVADVGLVGLPNAGKSMLLSVISKAKPKVAGYPFTTIIPNLGVVEGERFGFSGGEGFVVCDIPGLIEDASKGKGLGDEFLKHVERTRLIVHLVDASDENLENNFETIEKELLNYKKEVFEKPQIVLLTKSDIVDEKEMKKKAASIKKKMKKYPQVMLKDPIVISSVAHQNLKELIHHIYSLLDSLPKEKPFDFAQGGDDEYKVFTIEDVKEDTGFTVSKEGDAFVVKSKKIERFAARTDFSNKHSVYRLKDIIKRMGIEKELVKKGITEGDKIHIKDKELEF
ncbi:hypothetical protein COY62_02685 [bacterium (Candidatus Howlettbacteria) CG_4_10_14_0_8_um_filter_40_9]|nr:MAG: hypothetical protein COY62_02685 [bacterium (Candidatus Howlettbacteria) CG_4_10_14_0_8_um_filter_40_9]